MPEGRKRSAYLIPPDHGSPIDNLPNDILVDIFLFLRNACVESKEHAIPGWAIALTHTCSRWRVLATSTHLLWTKVPRHISFEWQQTFVERSGRAPLQLSLHFRASGDSLPPDQMISRTSKACNIVRTNIWRMDALWLLFDSLDCYPNWSHLLDTPAPELRAFEMDAAAAQAAELPRNIFQRHAPKLESISLDNVYFTWTSLHFPELAMLVIDHSDGHSLDRESGMGTLDELLSLLAALPKLRWLELHDFLFSLPLPGSSQPETISVVQLEFLKLYGICEIVMLLMQHLHLSPTTNIFLQLSVLPARVMESIMALVTFLASHFHTPSALAIKFVADEFCFNFYTEPQSYLEKYHGEHGLSPLTLEYQRPNSVDSQTFWLRIATHIVLDSLNLSQLTALHIESASLDVDGVPAWQPVLLVTRALEDLGLKGPALPEICKGLSRLLEDGNLVDGKPEPILPSLRHLTLWDFSFESLVDVARRDLEAVYWDIDNRPVAKDPDTMSNPNEEQQEDVLGWIWEDARFDWILSLRRRAVEWKPLERLVLNGCTGLPDWQWEEYLFGMQSTKRQNGRRS
ncbi:hypothetical protein PENSPDRAFT_648091 [Peniophora sp. CONT]|nr:hypothetical protein PENSPDRAFT_648091 [Peniophora sp. CONT]